MFEFIYLVHFLRKSKLISTKELAYTPRHICREISAFPAPLNVGLQDGLDTWLEIDSIGRGRGTEEHHRHFSWEVSQLNFAKEWIILLLILVHCSNAWAHPLLKAHPLALFVQQYSWFFVTLLLFHVVTLLISMFWEYFPIEIRIPAPVKRALQYICWVGNKHKWGLFRQVSL